MDHTKLHHPIKRLRNVVRTFVAVLLIVYGLCLFVANFPPCQRWLATNVSRLLSRQLKTSVSIDRVELGLFNRVILHDVRIMDQKGVRMLGADLISAKIEYRALLQHRIALRSVSLLDADVCLYRSRPDVPPNYQFLLDAFKSKDASKSSSLNLSLNSLIIRRTRISYDLRYIRRLTNRIDPSHLAISGIDANLSLKCLTPDSLNLRLRSLSLRESSGLNVRGLSFRLEANRHRAFLSDFSLRLLHSSFVEDRLEATYDITSRRPFFATLRLCGSMVGATIAISDLAFLRRDLRHLPLTLVCSVTYDVRPNAVRISQLSLRDFGGRLSLRAHADIQRSGGHIGRISGGVEELHVAAMLPPLSLATWLKPTVLRALARVGDVTLRGNGIIENKRLSRINMEAQTGVGEVYASLYWQKGDYMLQTSSTGINLEKLFGRIGLPQNVVFHADVRAKREQGRFDEAALSLLVDRLDWNGRHFANIGLESRWASPHFTQAIAAPDAALRLKADVKGTVINGRLAALRLDAESHGTELAMITPVPLLGTSTVSGRLQADLTGLTAGRTSGRVLLTNFHKRTVGRPADDYTLHQLSLTLHPSRRGTRAVLVSDFANATIDGPLNLSHISTLLRSVAHSTLPAVVGQNGRKTGKADDAQLLFNISLHKSDFFQKFLHLPLDFDEGSGLELSGYISPSAVRSSIILTAPHLAYGSFGIDSLRLYLQGDHGNYSALMQAVKTFGNSPVRFALSARAADNTIRGELAWSDADHKNAGQVNTITSLFRTLKGGVGIQTDVLPTGLTLRDTAWALGAGRLRVADGAVNVEHIQLERDRQSVSVSGEMRRHAGDSLHVRLQAVDISYILGIVNLKPVSFDGRATGVITATSRTGGGFSVDGHLAVPDFRFNDALMGDADIRTHLNTSDMRLHLDADFDESGVGHTKLNGYVGIGEKQLDLTLRGRNTTVDFIRRYLPDTFVGFTGRTTGHCRIFGPFKQLDLEGREQANVFLGIDAIGCGYHLADGYVDISPGRFEFSGYRIADDDGGNGTMKGRLLHTNLKNLRYDFDISTNNLMLYNKDRTVDMPFYSTARGTGWARLYGAPGSFSADVDIRPNRGTRLTYIVDNPSVSSDISLLRFGRKDDKPVTTTEFPIAKEERGDGIMADEENNDDAKTDIRLNFRVDMSPEAELCVITDDKTGNNITLAGTGVIRATYYNKDAFQMYGSYTVDHGLYKLVLQDVIHKDLDIQRGGTIVFAGDPFDADLNLRAVYTVPSASLADLGLNLNQNSVRADCILNLGGKVSNPQITFGLNLPGVSEDVRQMVRQLVATEEDMNRQVLYLLGLGRFYNYNFAATDAAIGGQSQSSVAMKSFLSSTISGQLNDMITNVVGRSDWSFGTTLATGQIGWSDMEVGGLLRGRLMSGRLLVNGNFGYRERPTSNTNFVGDFDICYLLTPAGNVSLKAYSETNDRYFSKTAMTTQGIGILLQRDFTTLGELFRFRRLPFHRPATRSDTAATRGHSRR